MYTNYLHTVHCPCTYLLKLTQLFAASTIREVSLHVVGTEILLMSSVVENFAVDNLLCT